MMLGVAVAAIVAVLVGVSGVAGAAGTPLLLALGALVALQLSKDAPAARSESLKRSPSSESPARGRGNARLRIPRLPRRTR